MALEILLSNEGRTAYCVPAVQEGVTWTTKRRSEPGKLTFKLLPDSTLDFSEGSEVRFTQDGNPIFFGFVFKRQRTQDGIVSVTAYDQIRYLKNKDTKVYEGQTAGQLIQMLAADYQLQTGTIEDTGYIIPSRVEDNKSLLEMVENALDLTLQNTKQMFVMYDDFGKLALKNIGNMKVGSGSQYMMIDTQAGQSYDYTTSIDDNTYNTIKLSYDNDETGKRDIYIAKNGENINKWGVLQYFDKLKKGENGQAKADAMLGLYNHKTRKLKVKDVFGDNRVRAGSLIVVNLKLDDTSLQNFMLVEECTHTYNESEHWMDLTLRGGEFSA